jgi:hypothetical protein
MFDYTLFKKCIPCGKYSNNVTWNMAYFSLLLFCTSIFRVMQRKKRKKWEENDNGQTKGMRKEYGRKNGMKQRKGRNGDR